MSKISLDEVDSTLRNTYQEGHENDSVARAMAIMYLIDDYKIGLNEAEKLHDERIHKCGLKDTIRQCGEPSWVVESDKCPDLGHHDFFEEVSE